MFLDKYLTEYDDTISGDFYIDPLGTRIIWAAFGQQIFKNRVNSIANDVRNYTLNLFNHHLIKKILEDDAILLSRALLTVYGSKDTLQFKYACIVYLENLFVYSVHKHDGKNGVDSTGVIGITKARRLWSETDENPTLVFSHEKQSHILVRQLSLGVSGRYKTPMMEMGFFDGAYRYQLPKASGLWLDTVTLISKGELKKLESLVYSHLVMLLSQNKTKPSIEFKDIKSELIKAFVTAFSTPPHVGSYSREFWLSNTGLADGAAGAMLQVLDENAKNKVPKDLGAQEVFERATQKSLDQNEKLKIENVQQLEPFLADVNLLFKLITAKKYVGFDDVSEQWHLFKRDEASLSVGAKRIAGRPFLKQVLSGTGLGRMQSLLKLENTATLKQQITLLIDYHTDVMKGRGQPAWLKIDTSGVLKTEARTSTMPDPEEWPVGCWDNNYYIPQFKQLVLGYQGVLA